MVFVLVGGGLCVAALAGWMVLSSDGRDVARYMLITVMRWFN